MTKERSHSGYKGRQYRKRSVPKIALIILFVILLSLIPVYIINFGVQSGPDQRDLLRLWDSMAFAEVYKLSAEQLVQKPLDFFLLTINGFSAYQLAIAQINNSSMLSYINSSIWSLRKAMLLSEGASDGRVFYVLGKAYYYKGKGYEELTIKYLEKAREAAFYARDIPEYLGLAYANVRDYRSSIAAFTLALNPSGADISSDALLLSIASSYIALGEVETASSYLKLCLETSKDSLMITAARLNLAQILIGKSDFAGAEELYNKIIEEGGNADAHYYLGELYNARGEVIRARAEWRRAIQIDPSHIQARTRLNL
ncbi:MAG: tetratricopeptide repeat protein [Treponema sp.]|jgi:tetratricopeptide (TPR) repeat protein|nr:tetratricopeptide repeat protein [Treponema sp.]